MKIEPQNRRVFFERAARIAMLGSLGTLGALLLWRKQVCVNAGACRSCNAYVKCELPQKEKVR